MKRIVSSLFAIGLVVLGLAGVMPSSLSQVGMQTGVQADTATTLKLDVAIDCRTWRNNLGISFEELARGDSFIANGKIFPAGSLPSGDAAGNDPNASGSIGTWIERGTMAATVAEVDSGVRPAFFATWYHLLDDGRGLVADGPHPDSGPMAIIGGTGDFSGASGEISEVTIIGWNSTGCPNMRLAIDLKKQAPK